MRLSPTALNDFLACRYLTWLEQERFNRRSRNERRTPGDHRIMIQAHVTAAPEFAGIG